MVHLSEFQAAVLHIELNQALDVSIISDIDALPNDDIRLAHS